MFLSGLQAEMSESFHACYQPSLAHTLLGIPSKVFGYLKISATPDGNKIFANQDLQMQTIVPFARAVSLTQPSAGTESAEGGREPKTARS